MAEADDDVAIETLLLELERISFVAQRDARAALGPMRSQGSAVARVWLQAARDLFVHDRECGKSFMRRSPAIAEATGVVVPWTGQARAFLRWVHAQHCLDGFLDQLPAVWNEWGESGEQEWFATGLRWCERSLSDGRAFFSTPFRRLAGDGGIAGMQALLAPAESWRGARELPLACYLKGAPTARDLVGDAGLPAWARRGADLLAAGRSRGEAWFGLESEESLQQLLEAIPGYRGRLHSRFLQLLLRAWLQAEIPFADSDWRPDQGRPMLETDGRRLYLPAVFSCQDEAIVAVEHAAGHLVWDSYAHEAVTALFARAGTRHPPLDDAGRMTWRPLFAAFEERMFRFQVLFDLAEDLRINSRLQARIPGYLERLLRLGRRQPVPAGAAGPYYRLALKAHESLLDPVLDPVPDPVPDTMPDTGGGLAGPLRTLQRMRAAGATVLDAWEVAEVLFADPGLPEITIGERADAYLPGLSFNAARPVYPQPLRQGSWTDFRDVGDAHSEHRFEREKQESGPEQTPGGEQRDPDADIQMPRERTSGSGGRIGVGIPQPARVDPLAVAWKPRSAGIPYPEWDYREQRYLEDWVRLHERILEDADPALAGTILEAHRPLLKKLTRVLETQRPMRLAPVRRQWDGDELDLEAATGFIADRRAGLSPPPLIYRRRAVQYRDTAVLLLADLSTSIMARHPDGEGRIVDRIRSGLMLFSEALDRMGDPCAITGFASKRRDQVHFYWIKHFTQPLDPTLRARIAGVSGRLASRMGAALRHATQALSGVAAQRRLLLILSDGRPADYDDGGDVRYLHEDTRRAMHEAVDAGVHPFCITLDRSGSEYLPAIFGPGHYRVIDRIDELPQRLPEIYLRLRR